MNQDELVTLLKTGTASVPPVAKERVWRRLQAPARPRRLTLALSFAASAALGVIAVALWSPHPAQAPVVVAERAVVWPQRGATLSGVQPGQATLEKGRALASSWGDPLLVSAKGHRVTTEAARFAIEVIGESIEVSVDEGAVLVDGTSVTMGHRWPATAALAPEAAQQVTRYEPEGATDEREWAMANEALKRDEPKAALESLDAVAHHGGLRAQAALLKKGQVQLWNTHAPEQAISTFRDELMRFPDGSLSQEAELSLLDAYVATGQWSEVRAAAPAFLVAHPQSERRDEVVLLHALAQWSTGERGEACRALPGLSRERLRARHLETLEQLAAWCRSITP